MATLFKMFSCEYTNEIPKATIAILKERELTLFNWQW